MAHKKKKGKEKNNNTHIFTVLLIFSTKSAHNKLILKNETFRF